MSKCLSSATGIFGFLALMAGPAMAQGFYVSDELGVVLSNALGTDGHDTDRASVCDEYINPEFMTVNDTPGWESTNCTGEGRGSDSIWENNFGSGKGIMFGGTAGYYIPDSRFRTELEYFYRNTGYDQASEITVGGGQVLSKIVQEIVRAEEYIGDMDSHNLFVNVYMDFANNSPLTPYIGLGMGYGFASLEYSGTFARDVDASRISTGNAPDGGETLANAAQIKTRLAGTTTTESGQLSDTLFGYQVILGVDYALTESLALGLKARWVNYNAFSGSDEWDQLRSHPPSLRRSGAETVVYDISTNDTSMLGAGLNLKYKF